jgi:aspartyl-tRNA(Asn)/glutamyl-tRNA(Gln) amidotransferase subunit A
MAPTGSAGEADLHQCSVTWLAERIRTRELSPVSLCERLLERIHVLNPKLNAFRLIAEDRALAAAEAAALQISTGQYRGPLHGIPYVTKDLFDVAGLPTSAGSAALEGNIASRDAAVTARLAQAGMVLLGKSNTVEFAFGSVGINHSHGTPHNPWAREPHVPGGSSSGSAVAVAAGLTPLATGTDTACSVRAPAALCGVVGLKTTVGRISRAGIHPLSTTLDSVGPLGRSVADVAHLFMAMQGPDPADPITIGVAPIDVLSTLDDGVEGLRVAFAEGLLFEQLDGDVERAVRACGAVFESLGARVFSTQFDLAAEVMSPPSVISQVEGFTVNEPLLRTRSHDLDPIVAQRMMPGGDVKATDYRRALDALVPLRQRARRVFDKVDVLLAPTCMWPALEVRKVDADFETYLRYAGGYLRNCFVGNLLDLCAVSVPCGFTSKGLPIGLMIYARPFHESMALQVAQAFERASPWRERRPDLGWAS